ncbi:MAG TPA: RtcB family protein, partial [Thermoplasmata archaeon]
MGEGWSGPLEKLDPFRWVIPRSYKPAMRTDGLIFMDEAMIPQLRADQAAEQVANVATMPGIVGRSMAMPDIHWGYGFPIGGVAAFDLNEGVISPGSIGFDVNCLSGASEVLTAHGYRMPISKFERRWRKTEIACVNPHHKTTVTVIAAYMRFRANVAYRVRTSTGVEITATSDHPFLTPKGMVPLKEVGDLPVAVYPFRGVDYEEPPAKILVSEADLAKFLSPARLRQIIPVLRRKSLLPLTPRSPAFPYLLKIMGITLGDGHASLRPRGPGLAIYGRRDDLEEIRKDVARLGFRPSRVYIRNRHHVIDNESGRTAFDFEEASCHLRSSALIALLHALGLPVGNKAKQDFLLPSWLFRLPLWQKRLFLAALFGAEMSTPGTITGHGFNFISPIFSLSKRDGFQESGRLFADQIRRLVEDFGIRVYPVRSDILKVPGSEDRSYRFRVQIPGESENLIRLYSTINFEYHAEKRFLANAAAYYLTLKEMVLRHHLRSAEAARTARKRG